MKNPADDDAVSARFIEDDVFAQLKAAKTGSEPIARSPDAWLAGDQVKAIPKQVKIALSLLRTPRVRRVQQNIRKIGSRFPG
jgi:hypothetical protein